MLHREFAKVRHLYPGYAVIYHLRGAAYIKLKQPIKAIQDYDKAIELGIP